MVRIDRRDCTPKKPEPVAQFPEILQQLRRDLDDTEGLQNAVKTQSMVSLKYMSGLGAGPIYLSSGSPSNLIHPANFRGLDSKGMYSA